MPKPIALLFAPALLAGCYNYAAVDSANLTPGMAVRARISASAAPRYASTLGTSNARVLSGKLIDTQGGDLTLEVPAAPIGTVGAQEGLVQRLAVSRSDVLELEARRYDAKKTGMLIGVAAVGIGAGVAVALRGKSSGEGAVQEPPVNFVIKLVRLHF